MRKQRDPNVEMRGLASKLATPVAGVSREIAEGDRMGVENLGHYFSVGQGAVQLVRLALLLAPGAGGGNAGRKVERILDMPCGHGRVMRTLRAEYPDAELTGCDIDRDGVDYCVKTFRAKGVYSQVTPPTEIFPDAGKYDLIFVGSLLTHFDAPLWPGMLRLFYELLATDGILIFTTHGPFVAYNMSSGNNYGYTLKLGKGEERLEEAEETGVGEHPVIQRAKACLPAGSPLLPVMMDYGRKGFGYADDGTGYGISVAQPWWVLKQLERYEDLRVVYYRQNAWDNHQDAVAVVKRGFTPGTYLEEHAFRAELQQMPTGFHVPE